eukprot:5414649-Amphidinium_carterae.1
MHATVSPEEVDDIALMCKAWLAGIRGEEVMFSLSDGTCLHHRRDRFQQKLLQNHIVCSTTDLSKRTMCTLWAAVAVVNFNGL